MPMSGPSRDPCRPFEVQSHIAAGGWMRGSATPRNDGTLPRRRRTGSQVDRPGQRRFGQPPASTVSSSEAPRGREELLVSATAAGVSESAKLPHSLAGREVGVPFQPRRASRVAAGRCRRKRNGRVVDRSDGGVPEKKEPWDPPCDGCIIIATLATQFSH
jgi:hypothetical protein